jgi:hypothetical protein
MIKEALAYLVGLGLAESTPKTLELPGGEVLVLAGSHVAQLQRDPVPIRDRLDSIADLVLWVNNRRDVEINDVEIFIDRFECCAIQNRDRQHLTSRATVIFDPSKAFIALESWGRGMKQPAIVRALRGPLSGTCDVKYLNVFRRLNFSRLDESNRAIGSAGEKLGRSVELAAQSSEGDLPEVINFGLRFLSLRDCPIVDVRCAVEVDVDGQLVSVQPVGDDFEQAWTATQSEMVDHLRAMLPGVNVYAGTPVK